MRDRNRIVVFAAGLLLAAGAASAQKAVFVVRHAEKISSEDERLSEAGKARAELLAKLLKDSGVAAIYSTDTARTRDTAAPLARARGLAIETYDGPTALAETVRREHPRDVVLVVGHSNTLGAILRAFGCAESLVLAGDEYDNLFIVLPADRGPATLLRLRF